MKDPPRHFIEVTCPRCPLFESKPGNESAPQNVVAALESASRLKQMIDSGIAGLIYQPGEISARRCAAFFAMKSAEDKHMEDISKPEKTIGRKEPPKDSKYSGYMDD